MPRNRWIAFVAAAGAFAGAVSPASAAPVATVTLDRGAPVRECVEAGPGGRRCGTFGSVAATVRWTQQCAPGSNQVTVETWVRMRRQAGAAPAPADPVLSELSGDGTARLNVPPGFRVYAEAGIRCAPLDVDEQPDEARAETATATSRMLETRPGLVGHVIVRNQICGRPDLSSAAMRRVLQARSKGGDVAWILRFATRRATSALQAGWLVPPLATGMVSDADLPRIRLAGRGAGLRFSVAPDRSLFRATGLLGAVRVRPKRAGTLRLWATVDGVRSNTIAVRVLPPYRGGCPYA